MTIEGLAFRDRRTLAHLNEKDLLDIIEFLQNDREQWINQFSKTHNESIKIQEENQELKSQLKGTTHCYDEEEHKRLSEQLELLTSKLDEYDLIVDERNQLKKQLEEEENQKIEIALDDSKTISECVSLIEENRLLEKQLEERNIEYFKGTYDTHNKYYDQQQKFIKYLEDSINKLVKEYGNYVYEDYSEEKGKYDSYQKILQKYKEIMNGDDK